ncbi:hypothetical protein [Antrihabitans stalactiti]|uniref:Secreted protein n=1 Tax=Antrihabitans stalactiti TaxID=2584121 RepID=A0A848KBE2_9NOCA|nr:hypothetical protein [Antrihabitans stalactiti]NMN95016.1 hypothetical protein [Antrihabitans stalactiti]
MSNTSRAAFIGVIAAAAVASGTNSALATPPVATPEPGGVIRLDVAPGEWWSCQGLSLQPPFYQVTPGPVQYALGPAAIYMRFTPGADVWVECNGTGLPVIYYGPIVKAGN